MALIEIDIENFATNESGGRFVMCPFVCLGRGDKSILFVTPCNVHLLLANRRGLQLTIILSLHVLCYVGVRVANVL